MVYGSIIGLALVVVVEAHPRAAVVVSWLLGTAIAVALAEVYSEVIGVETRERHRVRHREVEWAGPHRVLRILGGPVLRRPGPRALVQGAAVAPVGVALIAH